MIKPCPYCRTRPTDYTLVNVIEDAPMEAEVTMEEPATPEPIEFSQFQCVRFKPCGHAFKRESITPVMNELRELRRIHRKMKQTTDPEEYKELNDYHLPAQVNAVRQAENSIERVPRAEEDDGR